MKQLLILSIFLTNIFAQSQMQRNNADDLKKWKCVKNAWSNYKIKKSQQ